MTKAKVEGPAGYALPVDARPTPVKFYDGKFLGNRRQSIVKIMLPDASPVILAGLRLGVAAGFVGVVLAELLITPTGIGDLITFHRSRADYAEMYVTIASIIALSTLTLVALQWIETRVFRPEKRGR